MSNEMDVISWPLETAFAYIIEIIGSQTNISLLNAEAGSSEAATIRIGDIRPESSSKQLNSAQSKLMTEQHHNLQYDDGISSIGDDESTNTNSSHQRRENNLRLVHTLFINNNQQ